MPKQPDKHGNWPCDHGGEYHYSSCCACASEAIEEVMQLRAALIEIHALAQAHREWAISSRCVSALGPGVPGVSAPDGDAG